jgi:integrase/recombinase XerC
MLLAPFFMQEKLFENYLRFEKRSSPHTIDAYLSDIDQFNQYLHLVYGVTELKEVGHQHIRSWVVQLIEQDHAASSINRKISSLKALFRYLKKLGHVSVNPLSKVVSPKGSLRLPQFVDEAGMETLFDQKLFTEDFPGVRDKVIIELFYNTGIRLSELVNLKESQVDLAGETIKVLGKRNKERIIPVSRQFAAILRDYFSLKKQQNFPNQSEFLIVSNFGQKVYEKLVYRIVNRYLGMVTTINKKSPHILRHTFATHMLNRGAELNSIKEILGHSSLAATQVYTHNSIEKLKDVHKKAHPKG